MEAGVAGKLGHSSDWTSLRGNENFSPNNPIRVMAYPPTLWEVNLRFSSITGFGAFVPLVGEYLRATAFLR
ncbi:hypothetical protein NPIL_448081 [Nephila pilipes]|uniref:Uncharacterized protein n=1 Tax=Nephila pilipes TaxID=299642 RepID=A0A8X6NGG0_NEPPI|nr:hypothetical protein NPIL_448081 [Nephila pilipes]